MAVFKCKMCGGNLDVQENMTVIECDFCGTKQTLPNTNDEAMQTLFNRANTLRMKSEFDKATELYEKIVEQDDAQAEAHWGIVLCKYGIEYVEDPKTRKRIPTCHRASFEAVTKDIDYQAAIKHADTHQKYIYEAEAKAIDNIQRDILKIVNEEEPFDVFICYKETDANGKRTIDSTIANDIYYQLTEQGYKVFYAAITLEDKLGQEYEPYIFAALNSAKIMLAIGTKPEYFSAVWVKNEWSRFLKIMKNDRSKMLIPCYRDMDAYELPEEFSHLQAQDMGKIGFINDVVRGIKKLVSADEPKTTVIKETVVTGGGNANVEPLLERAFMFLEDGNFAKADDFCEQVLNLDPKNAKAYVGKLMVELQVKTQENLKNCAEPFDDNNNYQKAIRFADENLKNELIGYNEYIRNRIEEELRKKEEQLQRKEELEILRKYKTALDKMKSAEKLRDLDETDNRFCEAANIFNSVKDFRDSKELAEECFKKAKEARKGSRYNEAMVCLEKEDYQQALELFEEAPGYKDSAEKVAFCHSKIQEIEEIANCAAMAKRRKRILLRCSIVTIIIFVILFFTVGMPFIKYQKNISLIEKENYVEAYEALIAMNGYKDSAEKAASIYENYKAEKLKSINVGDYIYFGMYEQDNKTDNGKENIEWVVLDVSEGKALVTSKYLLEAKAYDKENVYETWENSDIRQWLNNEFMDIAFSTSDKEMIDTVTLKNEPAPGDDKKTEQGSDTQDKVFLLSYQEIQKYFPSSSERKTKGSKYLLRSGDGYEFDPLGIFGSSSFWLTRTKNGDGVSGVSDTGTYGKIGTKRDAPIRPAMWIDISE